MNLRFPALASRVRHDPLVRAIAAMQPPPWRVVLAVLAGTAALGSAIALMGTSGWLISRAAQQPPVLYLQMAVVATRAFGISRGVLRYIERLISHDVALRGVVGIREHLYRNVAAADPAVAAGLRRGDLLARIGRDVDALADVVVRAIIPFAVAWTTLLATATFLAWLLPGAGVIVAVVLVLCAVVAPWLTIRATHAAELRTSHARHAMSTAVVDTLAQSRELRVARELPHRLDEIAALDRELTTTSDAAAKPLAWVTGLSTLIVGVGVLGCLTLGIFAHQAGRLDSVLLAVVTLTPLAAAEAISALPAAAVTLTGARSAAARVASLLDTPAAVASAPTTGKNTTSSADFTSLSQPTATANSSGVDGSGVDGSGVDGSGVETAAPQFSHPDIHVANLVCGWPKKQVLQEFSAAIPAGHRLAIVGPSGGGKTTLLLTLAGLLPPQSGTISISGNDDHEYSLSDIENHQLRHLISFTAEDAHVFGTTVRENLRVADPGATDDQLHAALHRAGLTEWAAGLPAGLDTRLSSDGRIVAAIRAATRQPAPPPDRNDHSDRGNPATASAAQSAVSGEVPLSGGERRRLLLARSYLVGAQVLLLDEPGEHLDAATAHSLLTDLLATDPLTAKDHQTPAATPSADGTATSPTNSPPQNPPLSGAPSTTTMLPSSPSTTNPSSASPPTNPLPSGHCPTVVIATHRVTMLSAAQEIWYIDDGRILARGSHDELMEKLPRYREIYTQQNSQE